MSKTGKMSLTVAILAAALLAVFLFAPLKAAKNTASNKAAADNDTPPMLQQSGQNRRENCERQCPYVTPTSADALGKAQATQKQQQCMNQCLSKP